MKYLTYISLFILLPCLCFSQKEKIPQLESELSSKEGAAFVETAIELTGLYLNESMFQMAERRGGNAVDEAKKLANNELLAKAYKWKGRALAKASNGKRFKLNSALKNFEQSNKYTSDRGKKAQNLQEMLSIAKIMKKQKEVEKIERALALNQQKKTSLANDGNNLFKRKKQQTAEELQKLQSEKEQLAEHSEQLQAEVEEMGAAQNELVEMQKGLINQLEFKEKAIVNMNEEQMKKELLLMEKERLLDSFTFINILDSLELSQQGFLVQQQKMELREQEAELELQMTQRNLFLALAGLFVIVVAGVLHRYFVIRDHSKTLEEKNKIILEERERSESLLLNILPKPVAEELKLSGVAETQFYENATVMFVDFIGFSRISKQLTPQQLVSDLDHAFKNFDAIIGKYGLEKIKTIGDAYMCAGGVPDENKSHPEKVVKAALEIQHFLKKWNRDKSIKNEPIFEARIGVHTGPLVAGVVGSKKFAYDIWGDTVNVAARMETGCEAGKVNISNTTFDKIKNDNFECEYRGKVPAKNVGEVEMYYVHRNGTF